MLAREASAEKPSEAAQVERLAIGGLEIDFGGDHVVGELVPDLVSAGAQDLRGGGCGHERDAALAKAEGTAGMVHVAVGEERVGDAGGVEPCPGDAREDVGLGVAGAGVHEHRAVRRGDQVGGALEGAAGMDDVDGHGDLLAGWLAIVAWGRRRVKAWQARFCVDVRGCV